MQFSEIIAKSNVKPLHYFGDFDVTGIEGDSRKCSSGSLFVCTPSVNGDSHRFLSDAFERGAKGAITHSDDGTEMARHLGMAVLQTSAQIRDFNSSVGLICRQFYGDPTARMKVVAVTGTNGKSTTAWMIANALNALGHESAYLGTLGFIFGATKSVLENTTPFPVELHHLLSIAEKGGGEYFVMEASSHALEENRVAEVRFYCGVFTNLSQDHLDFHGSMEAYEAAKLRLFTDFGPKAAINVDDATGARWVRDVLPNALQYGLDNGSLRARATSIRFDSVDLELNEGAELAAFRGRCGGEYNVENYLSAAAGLRLLGFELPDIAIALGKSPPVPGRFESVPNELGIGILIDYAHTPDALAKVLTTARKLTKNRLIAVFGCGGDRDRTKRPKMAAAVSAVADVAIVTSDNPRTEDPQSIVDEILVGLAPGTEHRVIVDRRDAVREAIHMANPGDLVVIAGKGHEDYQIIGRTKISMDDRQLARDAIEQFKAVAK